jgi:nucleotide-binding universal stress UspA family protein
MVCQFPVQECLMMEPDPNASLPDRVFLVVVDDTPEMSLALRYAARRALHVNGRVVLLHVIEPTDRQHWMALESLMRAERREEAETFVQAIAEQVRSLTGVAPIVHIREGQPRDALFKLLEEDRTISILILATGLGETGPGPLVAALSGKDIARLRVPVTFVPGTLSDADIDRLS